MKYNFRNSILPNAELPEDSGIPPEATKAETTPPVKEEPLGDAGKQALERERAARREAEKQAKALAAKFAGIDPEEYQSLVQLKQQQAEAEKARQLKDLEDQKKYEEAIAAKESQFQSETEKLRKQVEELQARISTKDQAIAVREVQRAFTVALTADEIGGFADDASILLAAPEIGGWLKYDDQLDEVIVVDPKSGDRPTNDKGNYLSIKEWILSWKQQRLRFFKPKTQHSGAGVAPAKFTPGPPVTGDAKTFNFADAMTRARKRS